MSISFQTIMETMMKRVTLSLLLMLLATSSYGLDKCMSGSYYDPVKDGEGFDIQVSDDTIVVYFFGYVGEELLWLAASGPNSDASEIELEAFEMERFNGENLVAKAGKMFISTWDDPTKLTISWDFDIDYAKLRNPIVSMPWCLSADCFGDETVTALFRPTECE